MAQRGCIARALQPSVGRVGHRSRGCRSTSQRARVRALLPGRPLRAADEASAPQQCGTPLALRITKGVKGGPALAAVQLLGATTSQRLRSGREPQAMLRLSAGLLALAPMVSGLAVHCPSTARPRCRPRCSPARPTCRCTRRRAAARRPSAPQIAAPEFSPTARTWSSSSCRGSSLRAS